MEVRSSSDGVEELVPLMEVKSSSDGGEEFLWVLLFRELDQLHLREGLLLGGLWCGGPGSEGRAWWFSDGWSLKGLGLLSWMGVLCHSGSWCHWELIKV